MKNNFIEDNFTVEFGKSILEILSLSKEECRRYIKGYFDKVKMVQQVWDVEERTYNELVLKFINNIESMVEVMSDVEILEDEILEVEDIDFFFNNIGKDNKKLLPCPFCGGDDVKIKRIEHDVEDYYDIRCMNEDCYLCDGGGWSFGTEEEVINLWNKRNNSNFYQLYLNKRHEDISKDTRSEKNNFFDVDNEFNQSDTPTQFRYDDEKPW